MVFPSLSQHVLFRYSCFLSLVTFFISFFPFLWSLLNSYFTNIFQYCSACFFMPFIYFSFYYGISFCSQSNYHFILLAFLHNCYYLVFFLRAQKYFYFSFRSFHIVHSFLGTLFLAHVDLIIFFSLTPLPFSSFFLVFSYFRFHT